MISLCNPGCSNNPLYNSKRAIFLPHHPKVQGLLLMDATMLGLIPILSFYNLQVENPLFSYKSYVNSFLLVNMSELRTSLE